MPAPASCLQEAASGAGGRSGAPWEGMEPQARSPIDRRGEFIPRGSAWASWRYTEAFVVR